MLPPEYLTPEGADLKRLLEDDGEVHMASFTPLEKDDVYLLGTVIQMYNFIELNFRRSIEVFVRKGMLQSKAAKTHGKIRSADLVETIKSVVQSMQPSEENIAGTIERLNKIESLRPFRNLFAHFAALRFPFGKRAIYFMTKYNSDALQVLGEETKEDYCAHAVLILDDIQRLCEELDVLQRWAALKTTEWYHRYL